jgi:hypothetical protein
MVIDQCEVSFNIGQYKDEIIYVVIPMDVYHLLLGKHCNVENA